MKNKLLLIGLLGTVGVLGYFFLKRKPQQVSTMPTQPPIPDSPPSKPEQSFLGATIVRQEKDGSSVQTTVKKDPSSNFYTQDTSLEEANFLIKQIKDLKKLSESTSGCKSARHRKTCMARKKVRYQADIKPIEGKLAKLGWVKVGERYVKAGTVLG